MEYIQDLESTSTTKVRKAAELILKNELEGYCPYLLEALTREIEKPKAWKTQCQLINAIALTNCIEALPTLKQLVDRNYDSTILYRELGFAIFILENTDEMNLEFLYQSIEKGNVLQIAGACAGILFKKIIPPTEDIKKIISGISQYIEDEDKITTPRTYIAAVAHLWPKEETKEFLESCKKSKWQGLVEIAEDALQGKASTKQLV